MNYFMNNFVNELLPERLYVMNYDMKSICCNYMMNTYEIIIVIPQILTISFCFYPFYSHF